MFTAFRVLHIVCGTFWAGAALLIAGFMEPTVRALGPEGGRFMGRFMGRSGFPIAMTGAGLVTVVTGLYLIWVRSGGFAAGWPATTFDRLMALGGVASTAAFLLGIGVNAPTAARLGRLGATAASGGPPSAEQQQQIATLQRRLHLAGLASAALLLLATVLMAAARVA